MPLWLKIVMAIIATIVPRSIATAQVSIQDTNLSLYTKCLNEAITGNHVKKSGGEIRYSCSGSTARQWFNISTDERTVHDRYGLFIARYYGGSGYCAHQVSDAAGDAVSAYICEIVTDSPR